MPARKPIKPFQLNMAYNGFNHTDTNKIKNNHADGHHHWLFVEKSCFVWDRHHASSAISTPLFGGLDALQLHPVLRQRQPFLCPDHKRKINNIIRNSWKLIHASLFPATLPTTSRRPIRLPDSVQKF